MITVVLSEHNIKEKAFEQYFNVSRVIRHPLYGLWRFDNDIMLLKVWPGSEMSFSFFCTYTDTNKWIWGTDYWFQ